MKNVTVSVDDETYRLARIRAAEQGTSVSALVKAYLNGLGGARAEDAHAERDTGVREMQASFILPTSKAGPPWLVDGKRVWTPEGKPRQPGALRSSDPLPAGMDDDWPADVLVAFEAWDEGDFDPIP